jgi:hypothetical protein
MIQQQLTKTLIGNHYFSLLVYKTFVIPAKAGRLTLGPATMVLAVPHPNTRVDLFGQPIDWMDANLATDTININVHPLPTNNVPADFNGAVGAYSLAASISTNTVTVGDPITLTVQVTGRGPIDSLTLSSLNNWRDFRVYPPSTKVETTDEFGLEGIKSFEQAVIPENAEVKELPPITFSFFDPARKSYRTVSHPATPIIVRPGNAAPAQPTVVATTTQGRNEPKPATDIVHIKPRIGALAQIRPALIQQPWFISLQTVPLLAWLAVLVWRRREDNLAGNPRLRRKRQVALTVREGLADLRRLADAAESEEFYATVFRLLQEQLGERLDRPASAITESVLEEQLRPQGADPETLATLQELFQACNQARYAQQRSGAELAAAIPKVEAALQQLQQLKLEH